MEHMKIVYPLLTVTLAMANCASTAQLERLQSQVNSFRQNQETQTQEWKDFQALCEPDLRARLSENLKESTVHRQAVADLHGQSQQDRNRIGNLKDQSETDAQETARNRRESQTQNVVNEFNVLRQSWQELRQEWQRTARNLSETANDAAAHAQNAAQSAQNTRTMMEGIQAAAQRIDSYHNLEQRISGAQSRADDAWRRANEAPSRQDIQSLATRRDLQELEWKVGQCCREGKEHGR